MTDLVARIRHLAVPGYSDDEIVRIADTIDAFQPTNIYEWGTGVGGSARIFWEASDAQIVTVERSPGLGYGLWCGGLDRIRMLHGDGATEALDAYTDDGEPEGALFFLDGGHTYDAVSRELRAVHEAAPTAVILVHDVNDPDEHADAAVDDFVRDTGGRYIDHWLWSQAGLVSLWPVDA